MRSPFPCFLRVLTPASMLALTVACSGDDNGAADASGEHMTTVPPPGDASASDAYVMQPSTMAAIRLVNVSPDLGPIDFCWRPTGSGVMFTGPVLLAAFDAGALPADAAAAETSDDGPGDDATSGPIDGGAAPDATVPTGDASAGADAAAGADVAAGADAVSASDAIPDAIEDAALGEAGDAGAVDSGGGPGLAFGAMTGYVPLPMAGTFDIALVDVGTVACRSKKFVAPVTLMPGQKYTVAIMGLASSDAGSDSALGLVAFADETAMDSVARARIVNAALGWPGGAGPVPKLAASIGGQVLALEADARDKASPSSQINVDAQGYATIAPIAAPASLYIAAVGGAAEMSWLSSQADFGLQAASVHSGFVVNRDTSALGIVWCKGASPSATAVACDVYDAPLQ